MQVSLEGSIFAELTALEGRVLKTAFQGALAFGTDTGLTREENQDRLLMMRVATQPTRHVTLCAALADGMGGMADGAVCAALTLSSFGAALASSGGTRASERLVEAAEHANRRVYNEYAGRGGATLSAVAIESDGSVHWLNVGDSRIYAVDDSGSQQLTTDDTMKAVYGGDNGGLIQFIGMGSGIKPHLSRVDATSRAIAITSDGAHFFDQRVFGEIIHRAPDLRASVERTLAVARWLGSPDNATIIALNPAELIHKLSTETYSPSIRIWSATDSLQFEVPAYAPVSRPEENAAQATPGPSETLSPKKTRTRTRQKRKPSSKQRPEQLSIEITTSPDEDANDNRE